MPSPEPADLQNATQTITLRAFFLLAFAICSKASESQAPGPGLARTAKLVNEAWPADTVNDGPAPKQQRLSVAADGAWPTRGHTVRSCHVLLQQLAARTRFDVARLCLRGTHGMGDSSG